MDVELAEPKNGVVKYTWLTNVLVLIVGALVLTVWDNLSSQVHDTQADVRALQGQVADMHSIESVNRMHYDDAISVLSSRLDNIEKRQESLDANRSAEAQDYIEAQALGSVGEKAARDAKLSDLAKRARSRRRPQ